MRPRTSTNRPVALSVFRAVVPHELSTSVNRPRFQIRRTPMPSRAKARQKPAGLPAPVHCRYADQSSLLSSARCDEHLIFIFDSEQRSVGHRGISRTLPANWYDRPSRLRQKHKLAFTLACDGIVVLVIVQQRMQAGALTRERERILFHALNCFGNGDGTLELCQGGRPRSDRHRRRRLHRRD